MGSVDNKKMDQDIAKKIGTIDAEISFRMKYKDKDFIDLYSNDATFNMFCNNLFLNSSPKAILGFIIAIIKQQIALEKKYNELLIKK